MIRRTYLGLVVRSEELRAVALCRKGKDSSLLGGRICSLEEGIVAPSVRAPNIIDPERFSEVLRDVLKPLAGREQRIALSLPENSGRILLTEAESPFKSKTEGIEVLKWQLKNSLPSKPHDVQLDYQILGKDDTGRCRLAVAVMAKKVLNQYEEVLIGAGYHPAAVVFHSLNIYNYYRPRLDLGENFVLVGIEDGILSLQFFQHKILSFHRAREVGSDPGRVFQEVSRSIVSCREKHPDFQQAPVFLHSDLENSESLIQTLESAFERKTTLLDPHIDRLTSAPLEFGRRQNMRLAAAVGAAEHMM